MLRLQPPILRRRTPQTLSLHDEIQECRKELKWHHHRIV